LQTSNIILLLFGVDVSGVMHDLICEISCWAWPV